MGYVVGLVTVGDHIRKKRLDLRLLQRDVAVIIGVQEVSVQMWECYGHEPQSQSWPGIIRFLRYEPYTFPDTLGGNIKRARRRLGLTLVEFALEAGSAPCAVSRWEKGGEIRRVSHRQAVENILKRSNAFATKYLDVKSSGAVTQSLSPNQTLAGKSRRGCSQ